MSERVDHLLKSLTDRGRVVPRPRSSDAIGAALCSAFTPKHVLPADLLAALTTLDTVA